jgi:hypothetical protein
MRSLFIFIVAMSSICSKAQFDNFITLSNNKFMDGSNEFKPLFLNYLISFSADATNNDYYISPHENYSSIWGFPNTGGNGRFCFSLTDDRTASTTKLQNDLLKIKQMGFNVIRINPCISWSNGNIVIPTGSYDTYFQLMQQFFNQLAENDIRVIWVLNADVNGYKHNEQFKTYIDNLSNYFKYNKTIMAYVLFAEPFYTWEIQTKNDKLLIANYSREWYYIMKKNAPNHLITYGLQFPETVINWDPSYVTCDFMSYHFYAGKNNLAYSNNLIASNLKWVQRNFKNMWVMAETGYSGTNVVSEQDITTGTEQQQKDFAIFGMQRALDCGCKGYTWWQYQEVDWRVNSTDTYWENHLGLITRYPNQVDKLAVNVFSNYNTLAISSNNCIQPSNYYNIENYNSIALKGKVIDNNGTEIQDAVIVGWKDIGNNQWKKYSTFTDINGNFTLYADYPNKPIVLICLSHLGYSMLKVDNPISNTTYSIEQINYNDWMKMWTNDYNSTICGWQIRMGDKFCHGDFDGDRKDELLCIQNTDGGWANMYNYDSGKWSYNWTNNGNGWIEGWFIRNYDNYYIGDFNGDDKDELLCIQNTNGGWVNLYNFANEQWHYSWTNNGDGWIEGWHIRNGDKFYTGDFDGDGKDELMCIQNGGYANMYNFDNGQWNYNWTNNGNGWLGEWKIRATDKYYCGDFDGDGKTELFCVQSTGGTADWMTVLRYNGKNWTRLWSNDGNNNHGIYPYRDKLIVGNFDNDKQDEILGIYTWATKFDFMNGDFAWSWSTSDSKRLSDWVINKNDNCFFIKMLTDGPEYLFTLGTIGGIIFNANLYSMNYLIQPNTPMKKTHITMHKSDSIHIPDVDYVKIYPNPSNGSFILEYNSKMNDIIDVRIYNNLGVVLYQTIKKVPQGTNILDIDISNLSSGIYLLALKGKDINYYTKPLIINH